MDAALRPAITDIEVSWHLPDGYDVIQTPIQVPFLFDRERLILYGILSRPPDIEKESPRTPNTRRLDRMMRSFSNNSVKVFWFDDDMEYLPEEQLLLELDEQDQLASQETISELDDDVFGSRPQIRLRSATAEQIDTELDQNNPRSGRLFSKERNESTSTQGRARLRSKSEAIDLKSSKIRDPMENLGLTVSHDDMTVNCRTPNCSPLSHDMAESTRDIMFGAFFKDLKMSNDNLDVLDCTKNGKQLSISSFDSAEETSQIRRQKFASEKLPNSHDDIHLLRKAGERLEGETAYQQSARYHERDSGVGFSMDDGDSNENDLYGKTNVTQPPSASALVEDSQILKTHIQKNSDLLGSIGVPKNFAAVGIKGFVGDEEIEQVR